MNILTYFMAFVRDTNLDVQGSPVLSAFCAVGHAVCLSEGLSSIWFVTLERENQRGEKARGRDWRRLQCTLSSCPSTHFKVSFSNSDPPPLWLLNLYLSIPCLPQTLILFCHFALLSPVYKLLTYWQIFPLPIFSPNLYSHLSICSLTSFPHLSPALFVHLPSVPFSSFLHFSLFLYCPLIFSNLLPIRLLSSVQLYDMGSPADSQSSSPGCLTTDSSCVNMGFPSCGHRGRCHGEWGSFSCQCVPGYTGHQCEEGKLNFIF